MARKLPKRLVSAQPLEVDEADPVLNEARERHTSNPGGRGEGGAWGKAGTQVLTSELAKLQLERINKLLSGDLVIDLNPDQIRDDIGSDRNTSWDTDVAFSALKKSIKENGQDVPIQVQPIEVNWSPNFDETNGIIVSGAKFRVIGGRRRLEALRQLGRSVRAVCVPTESSEGFDRLHRRFRENVERENLSLFDELMSIGEMFSHEKTQNNNITGRELAKRIGVSEPKVSKGRALFDNQQRLLEEIEDPHSLTLHQIDALIPALRTGEKLVLADEINSTEKRTPSGSTQSRNTSLPNLKRTQIIKGKKIVAKAKGGRITLDLGKEAKLDETFLDRLLLFIQTESGK